MIAAGHGTLVVKLIGCNQDGVWRAFVRDSALSTTYPTGSIVFFACRPFELSEGLSAVYFESVLAVIKPEAAR